MERIRLGSPELDQRELDAVGNVLRSGMLVQGATVERFERALAERCQREHAVLVSSGTTALELTLTALGIGHGEVIVPDLSWPSPAHAVALSGATPVLIDVDPEEWNGGPDAFADALSPKTQAVIVIDQFGVPARHSEIASRLPNIPIIEDAACAIGSTLADRPCGSFGVVSCLSFHPRKVITTGEGGACLTDDASLARTLRLLRNHGQTSPGVFARPSTNARMTEFQAAIGIEQLAKLDTIVERRRSAAEFYREKLTSLGTGCAPQGAPEHAMPNAQTFGILLPEGADRDSVIAALDRSGVEAGRLSYAIHALGSMSSARHAGVFAQSTKLVAQGLALPLHSRLSRADQTRVLEALTRALDSR